MHWAQKALFTINLSYSHHYIFMRTFKCRENLRKCLANLPYNLHQRMFGSTLWKLHFLLFQYCWIYHLPGVLFGALCIGMAGVASVMGSVLQVSTVIALQHHLELNTKNYKPDSFLFPGSSVHIWHDQRASSWSLPFRHAVPHIEFNSEYFLLLEHLLANCTLWRHKEV